MQIIPAVDIRRGKCVRLIRGDVRDETVYSNEPIEIAKLWQLKGAKTIHVVDIDGALTGKPRNIRLILKMIRSLKANIEVGGGLRDDEIIKRYINANARRVILSTSIISSDDFLEKMLEKYKDKIVVAVDAKNDKIAVRGWKQVTSINLLDFIKKIEEKGVKRIIYTDINNDGVLKGPNFKGIKNVLRNTKMKVIVSGGISKIKQIEQLMGVNKHYGNIEGIIIGKALYTGDIELKDAIKAAREE